MKSFNFKCLIGMLGILLLQSTSALAREGGWVRTAGGTGLDQGNGVLVDAAGRVTVVGYFTTSLVLDDFTLQSAGSKDTFLARFDSTGTPVWLRQIGGPGSDRGYGISADAAGNLIITGALGAGTATFGDLALTSRGSNDIFVARYSADGDLQWARNFGSPGFDQGYAAAHDPQKNALIAGWFHSTAVFGPDTLTSAGYSDVFLAKLDPAGELLWARRAGGTGADVCFATAADSEGNFYIAGTIQAEAEFGGIAVANRGSTDVFIAKYSAAGDVLWAKSAGSEQDDIAFSLAYDSANRQLLLTGSFSGDLDYAGEPTGLSTTGASDLDVFLLCLDESGGLKWALSEGGDLYDQGRNVKIDPEGNIYVTGVFSRVASFGKNDLRSRGQLDIFMAKYNAAGQAVWMNRAGGGPENDWGRAVAPARKGVIYVTGSFAATADFGSEQAMSTAGNDFFLQRLIEPFESSGLHPVVAASQFVGADYPVDIVLEDTVAARSIDFDFSFTNAQYVQVDENGDPAVKPGSYWGTDFIFFTDVDPARGKIRIHGRRKSNSRPGSGANVVATIRLKSKRNTPFGLESMLSVDHIFAADAVGKDIFMHAGEAIVSHEGVGVWPGDTNNDKVVNEADVLPIGQFFRSTGPERRSRSATWAEQLAVPWQVFTSTYADANGDSVIDQRDVFLIGFNWKRTRNKAAIARKPARRVAQFGAATIPVLYLAASRDAADTSRVWVEVALDSVQDLFGLAFDLKFPVTAGVALVRVEPGGLMSDPILFQSVDESRGNLSVGLTRKQDQGGVTGSGAALRVLFDVRTLSLTAFAEQLGLGSVSGIDSRGSDIQFDFGENRILTGVQDLAAGGGVETFRLLPNSPNPFNPSTRIRYILAQAAPVTLEVYDGLGRLVNTLVDDHQLSGAHTVMWDGRDTAGRQVASGVYIYQLRTDRRLQSRKMLLVK